MKHYILNSAVITAPGTYRYGFIDRSEAEKWLWENEWISTVGYQETADAMRQLFNASIPINRKQIKMQPGDEALVFRLTRRLNDPELKGKLTPEYILSHCEIGLLRRID